TGMVGTRHRRLILPSAVATIEEMSNRRIGLWMIGAFGGVAGTAALGLAALGRGLCDGTSMVTDLPLFAGLDLDRPDQFVVGGHDIRASTFSQAVAELHE